MLVPSQGSQLSFGFSGGDASCVLDENLLLGCEDASGTAWDIFVDTSDNDALVWCPVGTASTTTLKQVTLTAVFGIDPFAIQIVSGPSAQVGNYFVNAQGGSSFDVQSSYASDISQASTYTLDPASGQLWESTGNAQWIAAIKASTTGFPELLFANPTDSAAFANDIFICSIQANGMISLSLESNSVNTEYSPFWSPNGWVEWYSAAQTVPGGYVPLTIYAVWSPNGP